MQMLIYQEEDIRTMGKKSGKPEIYGREEKILEIVRECWPISALGIAAHFSEKLSTRAHKKKHSTNYTYYLKKLVTKRLVLSKRIGNALVVWPLEAEAYRAIHHMLKDAQKGEGDLR